MTTTTTRRRLLTAAAAAPLAAAPGLALAGAGDDARLVELWEKHAEITRRWQPAFLAANNASYDDPRKKQLEAEADAINDEGYAVIAEILRTPARSFVGVAIKLRLWRYFDGDMSLECRDTADLMPLALLHDVERIAGPVSSHFLQGESPEFLEVREREAEAVEEAVSRLGCRA